LEFREEHIIEKFLSDGLTFLDYLFGVAS